MDKYVLHIGCHRGSLISRDTDLRTFDTEDKAVESYERSKTFFHSIGYHIWFANLTDPNGNKRVLDNGVPYHG